MICNIFCNLIVTNTCYTDFFGIFLSSLNKGGIDRPDASVLQKIKFDYANTVAIIANSVGDSVELYRRVKCIPSSTTRLRLETSLSLHINGEFIPGSPNLLSASDADGNKFIIKILRVISDGLPYDDQRSEIAREALAPTELDLQSPTVALVTAEVLTITDDVSNQSFKALKMPLYHFTLLQNPKCWPTELLREGQRLKEAIEFMHSRGVIHMDIKASNIFIDLNGRWLLGDFGSSKRIGEKITSTNLHAFSRIPFINVGRIVDLLFIYFL